METQRQNIQQLFLQSCNLSKNCIAMLDEKMHARVDVNDAKVHFDLLSSLCITTLYVIGSYDVTRTKGLCSKIASSQLSNLTTYQFNSLAI